MKIKIDENPRNRLSEETRRMLDDIARIGAEAVRQAREENRRLGLPNYSVRDGRIVAELPDGSVEVVDVPVTTSN